MTQPINVTNTYNYASRRKIYETTTLGYLFLFIFAWGLLFGAILSLASFAVATTLGIILAAIAVGARQYLKLRFKKGGSS